MERALGEGCLEERNAHPTLTATSALVHAMPAQKRRRSGTGASSCSTSVADQYALSAVSQAPAPLDGEGCSPDERATCPYLPRPEGATSTETARPRRYRPAPQRAYTPETAPEQRPAGGSRI